MRFLEIQSWILLSFLLALAGVSPAGAQDCENSGAGMVSAQGYSYVEPGELSSCIIGQTPKDRKYVVLIYEIEYADSVFAGRNDAAIEMNVSVSVAGQPLFTERKIVTAEMFSGVARVYTGYWGGPVNVYRKRRVEKIFPVGQWTDAGPVSAQLTVGARRTGALPVDEDSVHISATLHADIRLTVQETPYSFLPRNSADPAAVSGCTAGQDDKNCFPTFLARIAYAVPEDQISTERRLNGRIRFVLERVSDLVGSSTNFGSEDTPDYKIEPNRQTAGLFETLEGNRAVTKLLERTVSLQATLRLTSLDYAGTARLRAEFLPGGGEPLWPAEVDASASGAPGNQPANAACNCATIPYDKDGNEIADSWEDTELGPGNRGEPNEDTDPGLSATSPKGDGIVLRDEYRGFHYIERASSGRNTKWSRTKRTVQDVFYHDADPSGRFGDALVSLLATQTLGWQKYREVNAAQGNVALRERINRNSRSTREAYAVVYRNAALREGTLGRADESFQNIGKPIEIDLAQIANTVRNWRWCIASVGGCDAAEATLLAVVLAHETGHLFGQRHPIKNAAHNPSVTVPTSTGTLRPQVEYGLPAIPGPTIFIRLEVYQDLAANTLVADQVAVERPGAVRVLSLYSLIPDQGTVVFPALSAPVSPPPLDPSRDTTFVNFHEQRIMDWSIRRTLSNVGQWAFSARHMQNFCIHPQCQAALVF